MSGSDTFICHPSHLRVIFLLCSRWVFFLFVYIYTYKHIYIHIYIHSFWSYGLCPPQLKLNHQPTLLVLKTQNAKCSISVASCLYAPCFKWHTCTCPCTQPLYEQTIHKKHRLAKHCNFQEQVLVGNTAQLHFFYLVGATQVSSACRRWKLIIPKQRKKTTKQNTKLFLSFR